MSEARLGERGPVIAGRRVALRPVEEADLPLIHRWVNHPQVWRNMDYDRPFSLADVREDMERSRREGQPFTIMADDRPIGRIGLNDFRPRDRSCALYLYVGEPAFWGMGLATDAVMTLLAYAFERSDLYRVKLWALADNERAIAAYGRCGFAVEARLPERSWKEGRWVDHVAMSVTRDAFAAARASWQEATPGGPRPSR